MESKKNKNAARHLRTKNRLLFAPEIASPKTGDLMAVLDASGPIPAAFGMGGRVARDHAGRAASSATGGTSSIPPKHVGRLGARMRGVHRVVVYGAARA